MLAASGFMAHAANRRKLNKHWRAINDGGGADSEKLGVKPPAHFGLRCGVGKKKDCWALQA